jgi:hypothetical protein
MVSLHTNNYIVSVKKIRDFMFGDLEKTLSLVNTQNNAPNFLLALALCCYTEYWGQFLIGKKNRFHGYNRKCFNEFFKRLGPKYEYLIRHNHNYFDSIKCDHNIYSDIRCGLAHAYMIDGNAKIVIEGNDECGILYDSTTRTYTFIVNKYFEDFKIAVNNFIYGLESGNEDLSQFRDVIESKPMLI